MANKQEKQKRFLHKSWKCWYQKKQNQKKPLKLTQWKTKRSLWSWDTKRSFVWVRHKNKLNFKICDLSPAVSENAHVITRAVAREVSSCFLRVSNKYENVLSSWGRTQVWKNHSWAGLSCSLLSSISKADSISPSAESAQQKYTLKKLNLSWISSFRAQYYYDFRPGKINENALHKAVLLGQG